MQKNEKWHKNDMTYREKGLTISKLDMDKHFLSDNSKIMFGAIILTKFGDYLRKL